MRLYKMELYKICSKKMVLFSCPALLVIMLLYFWIFVANSESTVNGVKYTGYQAVKIDREITEEFWGEWTDQKVAQIVEKYGFPSGVSENYNKFLDRNYLNSFVMREFSDGYFQSFDDYHVGTCIYPVAETDLGKASAATGRTLMLEYSYGWQVFTAVLKLGCILGVVFVLLAAAPVFSEERYMNTQQILFTTKEGKRRDITAKIAAGMTVAVGTYAVIVILDFVLVWAVFGLDGMDCFYSVVMEQGYIDAWNGYNNMSAWYMKDFIGMAVFSCLLGIIEAAAISLYFSAHCSSPFQSVIISTLCMIAPIGLMIFGRSDFNGILFIMSQLFDILLLGIAAMCFVPHVSRRAGSLIGKALCCVLPMAAGLYFRRIFPFFYTIPGTLIMPTVSEDLDIMMPRFPWIREEVFLFAAIASVIFILCSWKKYKA